MSRVTKREAARRDLVEHFVYLAENAGLDVAERFLSSAEASFADLARQPMIGAPLTLKHPDLAGMRKWRVKDFAVATCCVSESALIPAASGPLSGFSALAPG
jgi:toxin ParE1/3/4